jgi:hypothetical protein
LTSLQNAICVLTNNTAVTKMNTTATAVVYANGL